MDIALIGDDGLRVGSSRGLLPSYPHVVQSLYMPETGYFHLHLVSDATGETLITVARAAAAQYANVSPVEHLYPMVRSKKQLDHALTEIAESPGLVLYTLLEEDLIQSLEKKCRELGLALHVGTGPGLTLVSVLSRR